MTPQTFLTTILDPGLAWCAKLPGWTIPPSDAARALLLAIAGQEGDWQYRIQQGPTPAAHGFYQFERGGGVRGILTHPASSAMAHAACAALPVTADEANVWGIMASRSGDNLATAFARLLLWTDPHSLPALNDEEAGWKYYDRLWRPGKPDRHRWSICHSQAVSAIPPGA